MNKTQVVILLIGLLLAGLTLTLILSPFSIYYTFQHPDLPDTALVHKVTCPAPVDSCDKGDSEIEKAVCDDCNDYANSRWIQFIAWVSLIVIGTGVGIYLARDKT